MKLLALHPWPADAAALAWQDDLLALSVQVASGADGAARAVARGRIRGAAIGAAAALLAIDGARVTVAGAPGQAPRLLVDGIDAGIGLSISHADTLAVAVLHRGGAVGVDLMRIGIGSDWARVAHDYLGMASATGLAALDDAARPAAFCRAWTAREAALKRDGAPLTEWAGGGAALARAAAAAAAAAAPAPARLCALDLPDGLVGTVAIG